jgi:hypothetical protein
MRLSASLLFVPAAFAVAIPLSPKYYVREALGINDLYDKYAKLEGAVNALRALFADNKKWAGAVRGLVPK